MQSAGLYYYFSSKDEVVIQCAEEAAIRIENTLIAPIVKDMADPDNMMKKLRARADQMAPTMRFLATVCGSKRYQDKIKPVIEGMTKRYAYYTEKIASQLNCDKEEIEPYVYMTITAVINYMVFDEVSFVMPQIQMVKDELNKLIRQE